MRSPKDYGVDRPDMEAPRGVESTGTNRPKQTHTTLPCTNKKHTHVFASTMQYLTQHRSTPEHKSSAAPKVCRWSIATGKRPDPFRTRKLSLPALMVLQPGGCGRVSYRRHKTTKTTQYTRRSTTHHKGNAPSFRLSGGPAPDYNVRDQPSFDRYAVVDHGLSDEQCISSWTSSGSIQVPALETICTARFEISLLRLA